MAWHDIPEWLRIYFAWLLIGFVWLLIGFAIKLLPEHWRSRLQSWRERLRRSLSFPRLLLVWLVALAVATMAWHDIPEWLRIGFAWLLIGFAIKLFPEHWRSRLQSWRERLARSLSFPRLLLVWLVTLVMMFFGWQIGTQTPNMELALLLFFGAPIAALVLTNWAEEARRRL